MVKIVSEIYNMFVTMQTYNSRRNKDDFEMEKKQNEYTGDD